MSGRFFFNGRPTRAALFLALAATAGCNLAPKYTRPEIAAPAQFREAVPADAGVTWTAAQPGDDRQRGAWWELYNDPQLNALEARIQVSNQTLAAAEANFRAARATVAVARSTFFPQLSTTPAFTRSRASQSLRAPTVTTATGAPVAGGPSTTFTIASGPTPSVVNEYSLPFDVSYEVDLWGRVRNTVNNQIANAQASAADLATARLSLEAELAQDYFQLRAIDAQRQILADTVKSYRENLNETSALFRAGIDSEEDVARAQTQLNTTVAQATDLGVARSAYEHALAVLVGTAPANFSLGDAPLELRLPSLPVGVPSNLLERRPDIASAERRVAAANAQIGVARAAYFPSLVLGASAGFEAAQFSKWLDWPSRFWSFGPQVAQTLFDGGARRGQTAQAQALFESAAANYRQTVLGAFQSVEDNLAALRILAQEAREQQLAVQSSQHLLALANTRFRTGIDSSLNVILAQTALLSNRETVVEIELRRITASIALVKALGGGWDVTQLPAL